MLYEKGQMVFVRTMRYERVAGLPLDHHQETEPTGRVTEHWYGMRFVHYQGLNPVVEAPGGQWQVCEPKDVRADPP